MRRKPATRSWYYRVQKSRGAFPHNRADRSLSSYNDKQWRITVIKLSGQEGADDGGRITAEAATWRNNVRDFKGGQSGYGDLDDSRPPNAAIASNRNVNGGFRETARSYFHGEGGMRASRRRGYPSGRVAIFSSARIDI